MTFVCAFAECDNCAQTLLNDLERLDDELVRIKSQLEKANASTSSQERLKKLEEAITAAKVRKPLSLGLSSSLSSPSLSASLSSLSNCLFFFLLYSTPIWACILVYIYGIVISLVTSEKNPGVMNCTPHTYGAKDMVRLITPHCFFKHKYPHVKTVFLGVYVTFGISQLYPEAF